MAHGVIKEFGDYRHVAIYLSHAEVVEICDAAAPATAFAGVLLAAADGGIAGAVLQAVVATAIWRLKAKNAEFGNRGLTITFLTPRLTWINIPFFLPPLGAVGFCLATLRLTPPVPAFAALPA